MGAVHSEQQNAVIRKIAKKHDFENNGEHLVHLYINQQTLVFFYKKSTGIAGTFLKNYCSRC